MSFFRYPGGKSKLKNTIADKLSENWNSGLQYREPFFGGGSIGLMVVASENIKQIWINDKDIGISCLWTAVIRHPNEFKARVLSFTPSVDEFFQVKKELIELQTLPTDRDGIVDIGFKKLAIHQLSYSGLGTKSGGPLGGVNQQSVYTIGCRWSPKYICKKIDKLHAMFNNIAIHENCCTNLDFSVLIEDTSCDSLLYLDPPYYVKGRVLYQHGFTEDDHKRLASVLKNTNHAWVLSYDDCEEVRSLYEGMDIESLDVKYSITATMEEDGERKSTTKSELLICSRRNNNVGIGVIQA